MINISRPQIEKEELRLVSEAVSSGWISSQGVFLAELEIKFAKFCNAKHCILTSNGTVAIHLALVVLNIGPGDEVLVPDLTFVATANAVKTAGATPIMVDVCKDTWCIDPEDIKRKITAKTKAIIPVHIYGFPADMDNINKIADQHSLYVIEDAAEAHGAEYHGKRVGGLGTMATFSFFANKIITTGEGGAITTNSDELAEKARFLRDHAMSKTKRYWHTEVGYNYRMTNMQAALGVAQMNRAEELISERDWILNKYRSYLEPHGISMNPQKAGVRPVNWITCVLLENISREQRDMILEKLKDRGIETRPFFYPLSLFQMYKSDTCAVADDLSARGLNLPTYNGITEVEIKIVCDALLEVLASDNQ